MNEPLLVEMLENNLYFRVKAWQCVQKIYYHNNEVSVGNAAKAEYHKRERTLYLIKLSDLLIHYGIREKEMSLYTHCKGNIRVEDADLLRSAYIINNQGKE